MRFQDIWHFFGKTLQKINPLIIYPEYKRGFYRDICFTNYIRLRYWSYFLILLVIFQLYSDLTFTGIYTTEQTRLFFRIDFILAFFTLLYFLLTHFYKPESPGKVNFLHKTIIITYVIFHLNWGALVSSVESVTANGLPTYLLGAFSAATLFYVRGGYFLLFLVMSLVTLYLMLTHLNLDSKKIIDEYYSVLTLAAISWFVSRIILTTRLRTFIATKKLEEVNESLDKTVKERTAELSNTNEKLVNEIKERKKYERELVQAVKRAEEADRLKTVFLANLSHEIRTPLNGILGFSDLLNRGEIATDRKKRYIDIILNSGQHLLRIIDDILDISLIESNQLKVHDVEFSLNTKIREIYEFFNVSNKGSGKENIKLIPVIGLPDGKDSIYTDPFRLQQVINNLLKNAFKFTFEGEIEFGYEFNENELLFFVSDTGIGIDVGKREIIFERFRQGEESLKRSFGGTGLGLSISKGIVEQLGGKIWLDTTFHKGARFYFTISEKALLIQKYSIEKSNDNKDKTAI